MAECKRGLSQCVVSRERESERSTHADLFPRCCRDDHLLMLRAEQICSLSADEQTRKEFRMLHRPPVQLRKKTRDVMNRELRAGPRGFDDARLQIP